MGFKSKALHHLKARDKINLLSGIYGLKTISQLKKQEAKDFLTAFGDIGIQDAQSFRELFVKHLSMQMLGTGVRYDKVDEHILTICNLPGKKFYQTPEWRELRYKVLANFGNKCFACGRSPSDGVVIHVDHILPRSIYPEHALRFGNMQVLCADCNIGKSNKYEDNWHKKS